MQLQLSACSENAEEVVENIAALQAEKPAGKQRLCTNTARESERE